jgi:hypothetical protein
MARSQPPADSRAAAAAAIALSVSPAVPAAGGAAGVAAGGAGAQQILKRLSASVLAVLRRLSRLRIARSRESLTKAGFPPDDVAAVLDREEKLEKAYQANAKKRLLRSLSLSLKAPDGSARAAGVQAAIVREQQFARQRADAQGSRIYAAAEREHLQRTSPIGAYWELGPAAVHTPDCLAMAGHLWPWPVLREIHPPLHGGCPCRLRSFGEAIQRGLIRPGDVPSERTAWKLARPVIAYLKRNEPEALAEAEISLREELLGAGADRNVLAAAPFGVDLPDAPMPDTGEIFEESVENVLVDGLLERRVSVGGYVKRDGTVVSGYTRFSAFLQQLASQSHPVSEVRLPNRHVVTVRRYTATGRRRPVSRQRFDHHEASFVVEHPEKGRVEVNTVQDVAAHVGLEIPDYEMEPQHERIIADLRAQAAREWAKQAEETIASWEGTTWHEADSEMAYRPGGEWTPERAALHKRIYDRMLASPTRAAVAEQEIAFMAGGPASGKSWIKLGPEMAGHLPDDAVRVDADEMKSVLPEYGILTEAKRPDNASRVHEESSVLAKRLYKAAVLDGQHVVFDGIGGSDSFPRTVSAAVRRGRRGPHPTKVSVTYVTADLEAALERALKRAEEEGRVVDEQVIRDGHRKSSAQFEAVVATGALVRVFDTNGEPKLIAIAEGGNLTVMDRDLFDRFIAKKDKR